MALESIRNRYRPRIPTITHVIELVGKEPRGKGLCAVRPFTYPDLAARRISTPYQCASVSLPACALDDMGDGSRCHQRPAQESANQHESGEQNEAHGRQLVRDGFHD